MYFIYYVFNGSYLKEFFFFAVAGLTFWNYLYEPSKKVGQIQNTIFIQMNFNSQSILLTVTKHAEKNIRQSIGRIITEVFFG